MKSLKDLKCGWIIHNVDIKKGKNVIFFNEELNKENHRFVKFKFIVSFIKKSLEDIVSPTALPFGAIEFTLGIYSLQEPQMRADFHSTFGGFGRV